MVTGPETPGVPSRLSTILSTPVSNLPNLHARARLGTRTDALCALEISSSPSRLRMHTPGHVARLVFKVQVTMHRMPAPMAACKRQSHRGSAGTGAEVQAQ